MHWSRPSASQPLELLEGIPLKKLFPTECSSLLIVWHFEESITLLDGMYQNNALISRAE